MGVISDTHGLIRKEINEFFDGCDLIIHAGDIINEDIIYELEKICRVEAVRGNNDYMLSLNKYPNFKKVTINNGIKIYVIHDINQMYEDAEKYDIVIHGHTHKPLEKYINKTLVLNPGSFGPPRFSLPISLAIVYFEENLTVKFYEI